MTAITESGCAPFHLGNTRRPSEANRRKLAAIVGGSAKASVAGHSVVTPPSLADVTASLASASTRVSDS